MNQNPTVKQIIYALRCANTPRTECIGGKCPYNIIEDLTGTEFEKLADFEKDGHYFARGCNYEQSSLDAADCLESMLHIMEEHKND